MALSDTDLSKIALKVWGYKNTNVGDTHDMHQALVNIEKAVTANTAAIKALDAKVAKILL
jgi:hypothetical protein